MNSEKNNFCETLTISLEPKQKKTPKKTMIQGLTTKACNISIDCKNTHNTQINYQQKSCINMLEISGHMKFIKIASRS